MNRRAFLGFLVGGLGGLDARRLGAMAPRGMDGERLVERWSWAMGQSVHLRLFVASEAAGLEAAMRVFAELRRVEAALSLFDPASELVALNERAGGGPLRVGPDLLAVLRRAEACRALTQGAFDPAVEPLMRAWGFRAPRATPPSSLELADARRAVAAARVKLGGRTAALGTREARLDLGGIGVGYGLDRAADVLRRTGITRALLEVSGDLIALGAPPGRSAWPVDLVAPPGAPPAGTLRLRDAALATSANTASVVRYGELVAGHVMDPALGVPARAFSQVSVIAQTGVAADAFATAMLVSGRRPPGVHRIVALPSPGGLPR